LINEYNQAACDAEKAQIAATTLFSSGIRCGIHRSKIQLTGRLEYLTPQGARTHQMKRASAGLAGSDSTGRSVVMTRSARWARTRREVAVPGTILGVGLGGFVDGGRRDVTPR
jgi:hypothetical protein